MLRKRPQAARSVAMPQDAKVNGEDGASALDGSSMPAAAGPPSAPKPLASRTKEVSEEEARQALTTLLTYIGEDPTRPGLEDTPRRVLRAWNHYWGNGYHAATPVVKLFLEENVDYDQMILVGAIDFHSSCEHHMAPFYGTVDIAYIPQRDKGVLGLSKFARIVEFYARRLQVQERLTAQIADFVVDKVSPDVGVVVRAHHMCMSSRGVEKPHAFTTTSSLRGAFLNDASTKSEFLRLTARGP